MFNGFSQKTGEFLTQLMFNNERPWFLAHKEEFEEYLNKPFKELSIQVGETLSDRHPDMVLNLHIARIYRDARRLHGGGPYKDHLWFSLKGWEGLLRGPMFWFELGAVDYSWGMGFYSASAAQMDAFRQSIDADPTRFKSIIRKLDMNMYESDCEPYKRMKKDVGDELNPWYNGRRVGILSSHEFGSELFSADFPEYLADRFDELIPLYRYLLTYCPLEPCNRH